MAQKYLDYDGLLYFWQKLKNYFVTDVTYASSSRKIQKTKAGTTSDVVTLATVATSGSYNDLSNKPTIPAGVEPSTTTPKMDGTATVGTETKFARGDHIHPTDTSRVPTSRTVNGKALTNNITIAGNDIYTAESFNSDALSDASLGSVDDVFASIDYWINDAEDKLDGIQAGAEVNQNAFSNVKVGSTTISADTKTDTLELTAGSNISLTPDATNDKVTIAVTGIASGAEVNQNAFSNVKVGNTTIAADSKTDTLELIGSGGITITPNATNDSVEFSSLMQYSVVDNEDGTITITNNVTLESVTVPDTTVATTSANGLMSSSDKTKLNGIESGAEVNVNADWNAASGDAQILNKPTLGAAAAKGVVTSISSDSADLPTTTAVKNYVTNAVTGAVAYQGVAPTTFAPTNYKAGWYWIVGTAGTYCGQVCEAGDMIFCKTAGTTYSASNFDVVQTNLDITAITNAEIDTIMAS